LRYFFAGMADLCRCAASLSNFRSMTAPDQIPADLITASRCRASGEDTGAKAYHRR
jgi:hypothetical protein